jgi:hypothetical protein
VLPGGLLWGAHANAVKDWAAASAAHGQAKIVGELPAGVQLQERDENGAPALTPEALSFLEMLQDIVSGEAGAGIRPAGSKTDFLANGSTAWQVFSEFLNNREKAAARIYLGTDAILGSVGGAPGVDISQLFGVASTIVQGDFEAIEQGLFSGVYQVWAAINDGDSRYAPFFEYQLPDPDAERKSEERAKKRERLMLAIEAEKKAGMIIDQARVNELAIEFGVDNPPRVAPKAATSVPITLAPTDIAKVVRVREARESQGLPPFGDARDDMTMTELDAYLQAKAAPKPAPAPGATS